jgi:hypothetical protein
MSEKDSKPTKNNSKGELIKVPKSGFKGMERIVKEALHIEAESAKRAGALGYMCRALTMATLPHSKPKENTFMRENGAFSMMLAAHPKVGLPYGTIPRCLICWVTTEAVKTKSPELVLGPTLTGFMHELGLMPTGGRNGTIPRLRNQMERLFSSSIMCRYADEDGAAGLNFSIAEGYALWWDPKKPEQGCLWNSIVLLGKRFFDEITNHPVPIDLRAVKALRRSPLALDIYCWLTHRLSYLDKITRIPWEALQMQFGANYPSTSLGLVHFRQKFSEQLKRVLTVYRQARVENGGANGGLILIPSSTHIPKGK